MRLNDVIKFQKALALAASAANPFEAEAAELAVRRLVTANNLDPTRIPEESFCSHIDFTGNALLQKLRDEWRAAHPHYSYKTSKDGFVRRLRRKPKPESAKPVNTKPKRATPVMYEGMFDDFAVNTKPKAKPTAKPVNTKPSKPSSDRNRDRHSPGYMRDYMRRRRAR